MEKSKLSYCSMYLKQIVVRNLQSLGELVVDLPPTGLVVFTGQNSNGKSIITKTTLVILDGKINRPRKRASLVNRDAMFGEIEYLRSDDVKLTVHITREAASVWFKYEQPGQEPIVRYLQDKSYTDLVHKFGWHYDKDSGISLNIAEAEDALLFYKTKYTINRSVIETATSDETANQIAENIENTVKETRKLREQWISEFKTYSEAIRNLNIEERGPMQVRLETLERCNRNLSAIYFPTIPEIKAVPKVKYANVYIPGIPAIKYPKILNMCVNIPDILPIASELKTLREHKCPTCGRGFDCACEDTVH